MFQVPGRIALAHDAQHFLERGRDDGAAGLAAVEEGVLVDFLGIRGVADEDDVEMLVAPGQEHVEQQEEALRQILHRLGHRARHVHQAEHHRLRHRLRHPLEPVVADIERIDEGEAPGAALRRFEIVLALRGCLEIVGGAGEFELPLDRRDLRRRGPIERDAPRQRVAHGAPQIEVGGRAVDRIAGARQLRRLGFLEIGLDELGQFEIVEEEIEEFLLRQHELEGILLAVVGIAGLAAALALAARGRSILSPTTKFLLPGTI